ncbi:oxidoreductase domain protein [Basidiobolus meristosporus CBS 931.73]|uniref:Oxidoreductase domain protein n=1 Tax=Basidiobolus meristosporus CBS 931.73 TaxID=1314790 RepID=A0A1Y1Y1R1_9FUNG|nr:oxidoreductase domain protein [Basidiobolus meristosporus CBS 931.73]|eukprot:ORX91951.1 oxidoreductase domain protein [Basidiobolus meristosporus CBS 931.73]
MSPTKFALVGGSSWRAEFFYRIAQALPERFTVLGATVRDESKGEAIQSQWGFPTYRTLEQLLEEHKPDLDFVVVSVPWALCAEYIKQLARLGIPVLSETPPAPDVAGLNEVWKIIKETKAKVQVAEQYQFQPLHAARIQVANSGDLGKISQAQVSVCHGYHGISLMRKLLNIHYENATITAHTFTSPVVAGPDRSGPPKTESITSSTQTIAILDFGDRLGVFDFVGDQYFSYIRSNRVLVRGERGEINNDNVNYLESPDTPISYRLERLDAGLNGNLEGYYHKGIMGGGKWMYKNQFVGARLSDDEIAVAACMDAMRNYLATGVEFYSVAEAAQDHYLNMMIEQAAGSGEKVKTSSQIWSTDFKE